MTDNDRLIELEARVDALSPIVRLNVLRYRRLKAFLILFVFMGTLIGLKIERAELSNGQVKLFLRDSSVEMAEVVAGIVACSIVMDGDLTKAIALISAKFGK